LAGLRALLLIPLLHIPFAELRVAPSFCAQDDDLPQHFPVMRAEFVIVDLAREVIMPFETAGEQHVWGGCKVC
jgi:hypothetical protein